MTAEGLGQRTREAWLTVFAVTAILVVLGWAFRPVVASVCPPQTAGAARLASP